MGLFFTIVYIVTAYLAPATVFGALAEDHIQIGIALLAVLACGSYFTQVGLGKMVQTYAILALAITVALSIMFNGWIGGAPIALLSFLPNVFGFYLVLLSCRKKGHLQILVAALFFFAVYVMYVGGVAQMEDDRLSPYLLVMRNSEGLPFYRLRGLGFLNDPNDLAQFMVGLIPCTFLFWRKKKMISNLLLVYVPAGVLIFGMFLTHSRGGMVALLAATIIAGRRKIGILPSVVAGLVVFAGLTVAGFSGGRDVNAESGADRMEAWSTGLELIKHHPFFGVGFERFDNFFYITAHNTVMVTAAELGLIGLFFWMLFILPTVRNVVAATRSSETKKEKKFADPAAGLDFATGNLALAGASDASALGSAHLMPMAAVGPSTETAMKPVAFGDRPLDFVEDSENDELWSREEIYRLNNLMVVSLTGFLTAGWFLSRPYTMTLYVNAGIAAVIYRLSCKQEFVAQPMPLGRTAKLSAIASVIGILIVYIIIRVQHMTA